MVRIRWGSGRQDQHCDDADHAKPVIARVPVHLARIMHESWRV